MKNSLQNWMAEVTKFLTGVPDDKKPIIRRMEQQPIEGSDAVGHFDHEDDHDIEPTPLPVATEAAASDPMTKDAPVQVRTDIPPIQTPVAPPPPTEPFVTPPAEKDAWLRDQLKAITQQIEAQGNRFQKIEDAVGATEDSRRLLEEQEKLIQDLTTRLREAEECQTTNAIMEPVVSGLIQIFDTVWSAKQDWKKQRPANVEEWITNCLGTIDGEILAMLNRYGTVVIQDTTTVLSPGKQRVVGTQLPRQIRDGEVISVVRPGFVRNGRVERPEEVIVARTTQGGVK